ncbi:hypothetical protein [Dactylosporangium sp. NPDC000521]
MLFRRDASRAGNQLQTATRKENVMTDITIIDEDNSRLLEHTVF